MTIRVEREALLRVISRAPSLPSSFKGLLIGEEEFVIVELPETKQELPFLIDNNITTDDDQASVCSLSTSSVTTASTTDDEEDASPRVSFATGLVSDVWTRERTALEDVSMLFYSSEETQKFRQEYRLERKVLNDLSIDPETFPGTEEELMELVAKATASPTSTALSSNSNSPLSPGRHSISRVVVLHNDKLETFFNDPEPSTSSDVDFLSSLISPTAEQPQDVSSPQCSSSSGSDFFDNDSFWSGSLTWY